MSTDLAGQRSQLLAVRTRLAAACDATWPLAEQLEWSGTAHSLYRLCLLKLRADAARALDDLSEAIAQSGRALETMAARE